MNNSEKSKDELISEVISLRADLEKSKKTQNTSKREQFLDHVLSASLCGIYVYNIVEGRNDYISPQYTQITGWTIDELNTMSQDEFATLFHSEERDLVFTHMEMIIAGSSKKEPLEVEYRFKRKDGRWIWCLSRDAAFQQAPDGSVISFIGTFLDITERKQSERELQKMDKLKSVGVLAGGIAHDFNNILMGLFGNISIAKSSLSKAHFAFESLDEAEKSMNRAIHLTKQLLTFAKGGEPVKEEAHLEKLVKEIVGFELSGSNVKPVFEIAPDLWLAKVDKGQIEQVFSNLTINANQAMPSGGHIYITLENTEVSEPSLSKLKAGKYIKATVRDEGAGIERKHLEQIFDPYYTTKQTGSGLGLATVYSIIDKHGGNISVHSQLGKETIFTFYLPASLKELPKIKEVKIADLREEKNAKVLVMDDEEIVCDVATKILEKNGCKVDIAFHGEQALTLYKKAMESDSSFDLVILDLTIPGGMGGLETMEQLLLIDPQVKVIVSSGYANNTALAHYRSYGFKDILPKPYTLFQLEEVLSRVLKK